MGVGGWNHRKVSFTPSFYPHPAPCKGEEEKRQHLSSCVKQHKSTPNPPHIHLVRGSFETAIRLKLDMPRLAHKAGT